MTDALAALRLEGNAFATAIDTATAQQLSRTSNCPPWTLAELLVHTAGSIHIGDMTESDPGEDLHDAADYYRRPERDTPEYRERNVRQTQALQIRQTCSVVGKPRQQFLERPRVIDAADRMWANCR